MILGYTTGVYDLFHIGHLNVLKEAKKSCDYLIVGVTTDQLVQERKHKTPVIPLSERMEIVSAIQYVDEVVVQNTMDKMSALEKHKFHRMFVGDDWRGTDKWNKLEVDFRNVGVEIIYFPYTAHTSSSKLTAALEKLK